MFRRTPQIHLDWILAAVLVAAAVLRVWGLGFGLPHWWARPDEESVIVPALRIAGGDLNPHWFHWPSLYMYAVAAPYALYLVYLRARGAVPPPDLAAFYFANPERFQYIDRGLAAALGILSVYLLYRLALAFFPRRTALLAAFFLALAPLHVRDSHFGVTDVPATCAVLLAMLAIVSCFRAPSRRRVLLAGALCGIAASVKYNAGIVIVPAVVAVVLRGLQDRAVARIAPDLLLLGVAASAGFVAGTPYSILDRETFSAGLREVSQHLAAGHGADLGIGWSYHLRVTLRHGLGLPLLLASLVGGVWLAIERPRIALLLLSFPVAYYAAAGATRVVFFRHVIPVIPFLCLAAAFATGRLPGMPSATVAALLMAPALLDVVRLDRLLARTDTRVLAGRFVEQQFPRGATLYQSGAAYGHVQFVSPTYTSRPLDQRPDLVVIQASPLMYSRDEPPARALVDAEYELAASFQGHDPASGAGNVYDPLDAFYLPLRGFRGIERPGPNIAVYRRR